MRVEANTIQGQQHRAKINGKLVEHATMADDVEGIIEALILNPAWLSWLYNNKVPKKVKGQRITDFKDVEVLGTFTNMDNDVPSRYLRVRLRGDVEICLACEDQ
jgi:hypothetical protein